MRRNPKHSARRSIRRTPFVLTFVLAGIQIVSLFISVILHVMNVHNPFVNVVLFIVYFVSFGGLIYFSGIIKFSIKQKLDEIFSAKPVGFLLFFIIETICFILIVIFLHLGSLVRFALFTWFLILMVEEIKHYSIQKQFKEPEEETPKEDSLMKRIEDLAKEENFDIIRFLEPPAQKICFQNPIILECAKKAMVEKGPQFFHWLPEEVRVQLQVSALSSSLSEEESEIKNKSVKNNKNNFFKKQHYLLARLGNCVLLIFFVFCAILSPQDWKIAMTLFNGLLLGIPSLLGVFGVCIGAFRPQKLVGSGITALFLTSFNKDFLIILLVVGFLTSCWLPYNKSKWQIPPINEDGVIVKLFPLTVWGFPKFWSPLSIRRDDGILQVWERYFLSHPTTECYKCRDADTKASVLDVFLGSLVISFTKREVSSDEKETYQKVRIRIPRYKWSTLLGTQSKDTELNAVFQLARKEYKNSVGGIVEHV